MTIESLAESFREAKAKTGHPARIKYPKKLKDASIEYFKANPKLTPNRMAAMIAALYDFEEESKKRLRDLRAEARRLGRDLKEQSTPAVDKMAHELRTAKIPQGIICPECRGEIKDQGKYREAVEIDVHPSRFVKRTVNLHKGSCSCGGATLRMPAPIRATEGSKFSPRFVSQLALDKFDMSLPLYRQRRMMSGISRIL